MNREIKRATLLELKDGSKIYWLSKNVGHLVKIQISAQKFHQIFTSMVNII